MRVTDSTSRALLAAASAVSLLLIGLLWAMRSPSEVCIAISVYPPPPGCRGTSLEGVALAGIGVILVVMAAHVVSYFTTIGRRRAVLQWIFSASLVVAFAACSLAILAARGGAFAPGYPLPIDIAPY